MLKINSPIAGHIIPIEDVNDPAFSEKIIGDGIAVRPELKKSYVCSPVSGEIKTIHDSHHAVLIVTKDKIEVLIHIGVDTVNLTEGFKPVIKIGDKVKAGQKLIEVDFPLIEKKVPSIDVIVLFTDLSEEYILNKNSGKTVDISDTIITIETKTQMVNSLDSSDKSVVKNITNTEIQIKSFIILDKVGLHIRPASKIVQTANLYTGNNIYVQKNHKKVNAKNTAAIFSLGIKYQDIVEIIVEGADATIVMEVFVQLFEAEGLGSLADKNVKHSISKQVHDFSTQVKLKGTSASSGLIIGKSWFIAEEEIVVMENSDTTQAIELDQLTTALNTTKTTIQQEINIAQKQKETTKVEILSAHLIILEDISLFQIAKEEIKNGKTAMFAWKKAIDNFINILQTQSNTAFIERIADFKDLYKRVVKTILGVKDLSKIQFPENTIIIAKDLIPSDLSKFDGNVKGVIIGLGSATSHVSLMLRNMGIPTLVGLGEEIANVPDHSDIILDANSASVVINPTMEQKQEFIKAQQELEVVLKANIKDSAEPAITKDGIKVKVKGNISDSLQAKKANELGAEGVGLLRTEFLFYKSVKAPTIEQQLDLYQSSLDALQGGALTIRTLDVGGDKPLNYIEIANEENPIMGLRGVRNYLNSENNREIFLTQIRAILQLKPLILCQIMLPMVSSLEEVITIKELIFAEAKKMGINAKGLKIGIMVEVPAAVLIAEHLAKQVDFFSIGTNDLAQYVMAMDRGNSQLTQLNNFNPALLKMIKLTVTSGKKHNIITAVCGAMASELKAIPLLIGLGITELSASARAVPNVKALIRTLEYKKCVEVASLALDMASSYDVEKLIEQKFSL